MARDKKKNRGGNNDQYPEFENIEADHFPDMGDGIAVAEAQSWFDRQWKGVVTNVRGTFARADRLGDNNGFVTDRELGAIHPHAAPVVAASNSAGIPLDGPDGVEAKLASVKPVFERVIAAMDVDGNGNIDNRDMRLLEMAAADFRDAQATGRTELDPRTMQILQGFANAVKGSPIEGELAAQLGGFSPRGLSAGSGEREIG